MSARRMTLVLGTAAGAFLAAGLIPLQQPGRHTRTTGHHHRLPRRSLECIVSPGSGPGFISATDPILDMFGVTDIGAADPSENFEAMILNFPYLGITDVLTSGTDPVDDLAQFGVPCPMTWA